MTISNHRLTQRRSGDWLLTILIFGLSAFGILMIYSASAVRSYNLFGYNSYYLNRQIWWLVIGTAGWLVAANIDYRFWRRYSLILLAVTVVLLIIVFIPGIGSQLGGASRWLKLGSFYLQPSEMAKLTFLIYLSSWLDKRGREIRDFKSGFLPFILIVAVISFLIVKQPDMGTMVVLASAAIVVFYLAGAPASHLLLSLLVAASLFWMLIKAAPYRFQRLLTFLNPGQETLASGYHISQALIAIGAGGWWGLGFGQSRQKFLYLPQAHTDSIFAIIGEELGFIRVTILIIAFVLLILRALKISRQAPDRFSQLLAGGIAGWLAIQVFINFCATIGLLPLTGVPLPFISYGGSGLLFLIIAGGILFNISKNSRA